MHSPVQPGLLSAKLSRLRVGQLQMIVEMERTGSIRGVAATLHLTQSAMSKALQELESMLDTRLYERSPQGVSPTAAGHVAARGASLLLAELDLLVREIRNANTAGAGTVRVGILSYLLPSVLSRLPQMAQLGNLHLEEDWSSPLLQRLAQGELDMLLILCTEEMVAALDNPSIHHERLYDEEVVFVAAPGHALCARHDIGLRDLVDERWLLSKRPSITRVMLDQAFLHLGLKLPRPAIELAALPNLVEAAAAGLGILPAPLRGVEQAVAAGRLIRLHVHPAIPLAPLMLVHRRLMDKHPLLAAFADALRKGLSEKPSPRPGVHD